MDITSTNTAPFRFGLLLVDGFALMSYSAVVEPLRAANLLAGAELYDIRQIPAAGEQSETSSGALIPATEPAGRQEDYHLLLVFAGGDPNQFQDRHIFAWLRRLDRRGVRLGGVSGGPVILANAGLMQGRRMTVHWEHAAMLKESHPELIVERSLYVMDRDRITVAGGIAPLDMMHALITEHHGPDFARQVSDWYMHTDIRPSGGPQRAGIAERYHITSPALIQSIEAMENHIADPLSLDQLTLFSGTGPRQLNRLFQEKLGCRTMGFYRSLRLEKARGLLTLTPLTITDVALATGFASSAHFASAFRDEYGTSPSAYRSGL
ncbi:AraC family transcriptional regulator with amidase-like domain [Aestuariispira insulae]|uniref:AraC family transcriptional regulator with amidase-like domain n=2 Tax=Aestuariispira insulae TaxID=1461337 RepID=A0A3D9H8H2_9PROT|nr:AraC family transcriptional regulator with amidase-like domain [Aestuariispira insulae]